MITYTTRRPKAAQNAKEAANWRCFAFGWRAQNRKTMAKELKAELTAKMHSEFMEGEISKRDMMIMQAWCAIEKGQPKSEALAAADLSEAEYDANVERVLQS